MAGTYTHFKFMKDLEKKISFNKDKDLFLVAGQGHDLLFFIKLRELKCFGKRNEIVRTIASRNFRNLVIKWQEKIIDTKDKDLEILLYGYIAHHVLDSYIHPWLNNKCNCYFDKLNKNTWKNNGRHETLESMLDYLILNPYKFKIPKIKLSEKTYKFTARVEANITIIGEKCSFHFGFLTNLIFTKDLECKKFKIFDPTFANTVIPAYTK